MNDLKKIVKKERRRFSKKRREIRENVREEMIKLVEERIRSFEEYLRRWCGAGSQERRKKEATEDGEGI